MGMLLYGHLCGQADSHCSFQIYHILNNFFLVTEKGVLEQLTIIVDLSIYSSELILLSRESMFLGSLSRHNKDLERRTLKPSAHHSSWVLDKPCYSSQANQCYSSILFRRQQENPRLKEKRVEECAGVGGERERKSARTRERESKRKCFGSSFYMFFPPPGPALCKLGLARSAVCSA